jgi:hypothetical protein
MDVDCPAMSFTDSGTDGERRTARRHGETGGASASDDNYVMPMFCVGGAGGRGANARRAAARAESSTTATVRTGGAD